MEYSKEFKRGCLAIWGKGSFLKNIVKKEYKI